MKNSYKYILFALVLFTFVFNACKPTEKGYKAAYDAAINKRQEVKSDFDPNVALGSLQQVDGPQLRTFKDVNYYFLSENLKVMEETPAVMLNYNVAVSCFKMPTNCIAMVNDFKKENIDAFGAKSSDDQYYVIIGTFDSLDNAIAWYAMYDSAKANAYLGLPGAPVIIYTQIN